jgi:ribonuclease Z
MEVWFLGTGAGRPMKHRNVTSIALKLPDPDCSLWMFDAGEGTQHQLMRTPLKLGKLEALFVTHLHGDHTYGIPGLLSTRSYVGGNGPLQLFGPPGIREMIETALTLSSTHLDYEITYHEVSEGVIFKTERYTVEALPLEHRVPCFGYRITECESPGKLNVERLQQLGVPAGPLFGRIKKGEDITLPDGTLIRAADVASTPLCGRTIAIAGDTKPCDNAMRLAQNADLLIHEATFAAGQEEKAHLYGHSTTVEAARTALEANAKRLIMTHFSTRFGDDDIAALEEEARTIFPNSSAAYDLYHTDVPRAKG